MSELNLFIFKKMRIQSANYSLKIAGPLLNEDYVFKFILCGFKWRSDSDV